MSKGSLITLAVLVVLILGGMFLYKQNQRSVAEQDGLKVLDQMLSVKSIQPHREYLQGIAEKHHDAVFESSFESGGLFAPSVFDEQKYIEGIWSHICEQLTAEGKKDILFLLPGVEGLD